MIALRSFSSQPGAVTVTHAAVVPGPDAATAAQHVAALKSDLDSLLRENPAMRPIFARIFLSDAANQAALLNPVINRLDCPVSMIEQAPLCPCKMAMILILESERTEPSAHVYTVAPAPAADSHDATVTLLESYAEGHDLLGECVRTWFFVNDIDNNYSGMVRGRNEVFARHGLTADTHFIASTGIAGRGADHRAPVHFDAYSISGLTADRVTYLKALSHLNPTIEYGVAFERATAVDFADRRLVLVSGTASIDNRGQILHLGDIAAQTRRMVDNVSALLSEAGCSTDDLMHAIVYLRDPADYLTVRRILDGLLPIHLPMVIVHAPVCRPGWLVEMECMALRTANNPHLPKY